MKVCGTTGPKEMDFRLETAQLAREAMRGDTHPRTIRSQQIPVTRPRGDSNLYVSPVGSSKVDLICQKAHQERGSHA